MSLKEYQQKRDFSKTKEPSGVKGKKSEEHIFVIQKHFASHLHYDFRLELDGVLKSWAVPKGPPSKPKEKRLAVEVEDHPVSYATFEGTIPKGEYGAGKVEIWDHGVWTPIGNPHQQLKKGHLDFELKGDRLSGRWLLVRTQMKAKKANWLLFKRSSERIISIDENQTKKKTKSRKIEGVKRKLPAFVEPALCTLVDDAPTSGEWVHEIKYDGYRSLCRLENKKIKILTRSGLDWTKKYQPIANECSKFKADSFLIDGEIAWIDEKGRTHFDGLQSALQDGRSGELVYYVFDLLFLDGRDLRELPLLQRKQLLQNLIKKTKTKSVIYSDHQLASGKDVYKSACQIGLEGIISKKADSPYETGRGRNWVKTKCTNVQEFVIGGYAKQNNNSNSLGSLLLGEYNEKNELVYVGRVGTGFNQKNSPLLNKKLKAAAAKSNPFSKKVPDEKSVQWVKPNLVANIEFGAWTSDHILRHAAFKGLREDKKATMVKKEVVQKLKKIEAKEQPIRLTHPDKVIFKKDNIKKIDLINYYTDIQKWILPHIVNRPLSLLRCPSGQGKGCFFQKHLDGAEEMVSVKNLNELLQLIQINSLELHAWNCHKDKMKNPDLIVFDLDPDPTVSWKDVKYAAFELKKILDRLKLKNFLKVSGNKGLHIHVPILPLYSWDEVKNFAKSVCDHMVQEEPDRFTTQLQKKKRTNKIFLDYLRNGEGATAIVPFSVRATPQASVAFPISWTDLNKLAAPNSFTVKNVLKFLAKRKDPWLGYFKVKQKIKVLDDSKA